LPTGLLLLMSEFHAPSFSSSDLHGGSVVTGRQLSKAMGMHVLPFSELRIGPPCLSASNCGKAHARWLQVHDRLQVLHYQPCIGAAAAEGDGGIGAMAPCDG
jgi:hypothetical protein